MKRLKQPDASPADGDLGTFLGEYPYRGSRIQKFYLVFGILCLIIVVAAPFGLIYLALALCRNPRVRAYAKGLEIISTGGRREVCLWRDVEAIWQQLTVREATLGGIPLARWRPIHQYRLRRRDGKEFKFEENYKNVGDLGEEIRTRTFPFLYAAARAACDRGEKVPFGSIWLSKDRLGQDRRRSKRIMSSAVEDKKWEELRGFEVRLADGFFYIAKDGKTTRTGDPFEVWEWLIVEHVGDIPNFTVLLALVGKHLPIAEPIRRTFLDMLSRPKARAN